MSLRIKLLRNQLGFSLESLASKTGLTKSYLSKVERSKATPSVTASLKIAKALNVDVSDLFGENNNDDLICIVRSGEGIHVAKDESANQAVDLLAVAMTKKKMQPMIISPPSEFSNGPNVQGHPGEEFLMVLNGELEIYFPERVEILKQGDSIYFRTDLPHRLRSISEQQAQALVIISK